MKDTFGDRMKSYEDSSRFDPSLPVVVRIDGKNFRNYTRKFRRPWDVRMIHAMRSTTKFLIEQTNAKIGYTQSDEITLILHADPPPSQLFFDGKAQKLISVTASMATAHFNRTISPLFDTPLPDAYFDSRVYTVPSTIEAVNVLLWREQDAIRNSVSMLARHHFSHKALQHKSASQMVEMLQDNGISWSDLPTSFTHGTHYRTHSVLRTLTSEELERIPEQFRPAPDQLMSRHVIDKIDPMPNSMAERLSLIFGDADLT